MITFLKPEEVRCDGKAEFKATGEDVRIIPSAKMSKSKKNVVDPVNIIERLRGRYRALVRHVRQPARA